MIVGFSILFSSETQQHREGILDKVVVTQQERMLHEEQRTAKAAEEMDARRGQLQQEEEQKKAAMLKSITEHREFIVTCVHMHGILLAFVTAVMRNVFSE